MEDKVQDVEWLDDDEQRAWRTLLKGISRFLAVANDELQKHMDLSLPEYEVLAYLSESPQLQMRMSNLAQNLVHSRSRLTHTVQRLEGRGYVERISCPDDKRGRICILTESGLQKLEQAAPVHVNSVRKHLISDLGREDFLKLGQICSKIMPAEEE